MHLRADQLSLANELVLELHRCVSVDRLMEIIPPLAESLFSCDRASMNTVHIGNPDIEIVPHPIPPWWPRYGQVYRAHLMDHPLWKADDTTIANLTDLGHGQSAWDRSTLRNEYFRPLGIYAQIACFIDRSSSQWLAFAINRNHSSFSTEEGALFRLIAPHLVAAFARAKTFEQLEKAAAHAHDDDARGLLLVHMEKGRFEHVSRVARPWLGAAFGIRYEGGDRVPDTMMEWLLAQVAQVQQRHVLPQPRCLWVHCSDHRRLHLRLAHLDGANAVVLVRGDSSSYRTSTRAALTGREREVLDWIREGKTNAEIGAILNLKPRTVGKHVEHILDKLGVENRTAAARLCEHV